jgi:hypothetical protein
MTLTASTVVRAGIIHWNPNICNGTDGGIDELSFEFTAPEGGQLTLHSDGGYTCPPNLCKFLPDGAIEPYQQLTGATVTNAGPNDIAIDYFALGTPLQPGVCTHVGADFQSSNNCLQSPISNISVSGLVQANEPLPSFCAGDGGVGSGFWVQARFDVWSADGTKIVRTLYVSSQADSITLINDSGGAEAGAPAAPAAGTTLMVSVSVASSVGDPGLTALNGSLPLPPDGPILSVPPGNSVTIPAPPPPDAGGGGGDAGQCPGGVCRAPAMGNYGPLGTLFLGLVLAAAGVAVVTKRMARWIKHPQG